MYYLFYYIRVLETKERIYYKCYAHLFTQIDQSIYRINIIIFKKINIRVVLFFLFYILILRIPITQLHKMNIFDIL